MSKSIRDRIAKLLDKDILEALGVLIEQRLDIGIRGLGGRFATAHGRDADSCAAMIVRIDCQHLLVGSNGCIDLARLFQRKRTVIGFRQRFFVDLAHGCLSSKLRLSRGGFKLKVAGRQAQAAFADISFSQWMMNSPFRARHSLAAMSFRWT